MKLLRTRNATHVLILVTMTALGACSIGGASRSVQYYALSPQPGEPVASAPGAARPIFIGVGPVSLPDLFDRPQIVSRPDANRVEIAEYDRWGSSLSLEVQHVLKENLANRLDYASVSLYPWQRRENPDLQITVQFFNFDGEPGGHAYLSGVWQIVDERAGCLVEDHRFDIRQVTEGPGYEAYVAALSLGLAQLSQDIASRLGAAQPGGCRR